MVIPLKWCSVPDESGRVEEMARYLDRMRSLVADITVVDGSPQPSRRAHEVVWSRYARLMSPDAPSPEATHQLNGKVVGALTGIRTARHERVILADDDIRHTRESIKAMVAALDEADLVRPVNVFDGWPWQARWDGARTLLNVALATDWPGTFGLRRSTVLGCGGWSAEVLFENLELWRTVVAAGGRAVGLADVAVWRRPPSVSQFWSQRVRQAYDDFAQPERLLTELAILPLTALAARRDVRQVGLIWAVIVIAAVRGRYRLGADLVPWSVPFWAPAWVLERGVCVWVALCSRLVGGVRYHGRRIRVAAHSTRALGRQVPHPVIEGDRSTALDVPGEQYQGLEQWGHGHPSRLHGLLCGGYRLNSSGDSAIKAYPRGSSLARAAHS